MIARYHQMITFRRVAKRPFDWALKRGVITPFQYGLITYFRRVFVTGDLLVPGSERAVEIPVVMRKAGEIKGRVLEVGDVTGSFLVKSQHLDSDYYTLIDWSVNGLDVLDCFLSLNYSLVISISTLEHIGLGHYQDPNLDRADLIAAERLYESTLPGGKIIVTLPVGEGEASHRVYSYWALKELKEVLRCTSTVYYRWRWPRWEETHTWGAHRSPCVKGYAGAVAILETIKDV